LFIEFCSSTAREPFVGLGSPKPLLQKLVASITVAIICEL